MSDQIQEAIKILKAGGVVAIPTSTSYGFAVDATNEKAVRKLFALKGRNFKKPIHVIARDLKQVAGLVRFGGAAELLAKEFWPGPLTLVLPLKKAGPSWTALSAGSRTLGVRLPDHPVMAELMEAFGKPITATSANVSGKPQAYSVAEIKKQFISAKQKPDFYLDAGKLRGQKPSTIVQIDGRHVTLLREGPLEFHHLIKFLK
jgi:L-threonylcarbamoyladenylate synthase